MSHNIAAFKRGLTDQDRESLYQKFCPNGFGNDDESRDAWAQGYEAYKEATEVAELNFSAGNEYNRVIYECLDATGHYCGCSGCGDSQRFNRPELERAREKVLRYDLSKASRSMNLADQVVAAFKEQGASVVKETPSAQEDEEYRVQFRQRLLTFLDDCLLYLDEGHPNVEVRFG
jgi:hypothetical protein